MGIPPSLKAIRSRASSSGISPTRESESRWWDFPHHLLSPRPSLAVLPGGAQAALRCRCEARTAGAPGGGGGGQTGGRMQRFFGGGRRACCNPFWNKPPHRLSPAPTSHKRLSSETQCGRGRHSLSFSLLPGKRGLVFAEASQPCPRWAGGAVLCLSPAVSGRCLRRGSPSPHSHAFNY